MSDIHNSHFGLETWFEARQYKNDPETGGLLRDDQGNILNEEVWHDPRIDDETNFNVILDNGALKILNSTFGLAGSGNFAFMAAGASGTPAVHTNTHLTYELNWVSGGRKPLVNTDGTSPLTSAKVVSLSTFNDTSFTPTYSYFTLAQVQASWNGTTDSTIVNQPIQEVAIADTQACPTTPGGTSGILLDQFIFGSATILDASTTLVVTGSLRLV